MDIVIIAQYLRNIESFDNNNNRFVYLAKLLSKNSNNTIEIVTSDFNHGRKKHFTKIDHLTNVKISVLHERGYSKNISLKRFASHKELAKNIEKHLEQRKKPDVCYCAIPSLDVGYATAKYCKAHDVRFIIDVQDLWPEAFQMVFNIPVISQIIFYPFKNLANKIYKSADEIIAVSQLYLDRAMNVNKESKNGHVVFLGTKLETFDKNVSKNKYYRSDNKIWIGYCGTLGSSYDLTCVIDAIAILKDRFDIEFIVMGDGPRKSEFEKYAQKKKIMAVFAGRLDYEKMCGLLSVCDIAVNPITHNAAQSIINKHADYAAAGIPIVSTQECEEYCNLVNNYHMGFNCKNSDPIDMAIKLQQLIENKTLRIEMGRNARRCAEEKFDRERTYQEIIGLVEKQYECSN